MAPPTSSSDSARFAARSPLELPEPIDVARANDDDRARLALWLDLAVRHAGRGEAAGRALQQARAADGVSSVRIHEPAIDALARCGAHVVPFGAALYPARLAQLPGAPALLFVRGVVGTLCARAVAIVGSRAPTRGALEAAEAIAVALARAGVVVISGLARGIDAAAHRGALAGGGLGIAVFGTGIDRVYPAEHRALAAQIEGQGALISELLPGAPPLRHHFPSRNRIVTGVAEALVVVEARERSGTLVSAAHAIAQGREVFVVPGPIARAACAGSNRLLRDGAQVLLEPGDLLLRLGLAPAPPVVTSPHDARSSGPCSETDRLALRILSRLRHAAATRDELASVLGVEVAQLALPLFDLGLAGRIGPDRDGRFVLLGGERG